MLRTLGGDRLRLSDLQGQPVVVNFWATWCATCRQETPDLIAMYKEHQANGLQLLGVDLREADNAGAELRGRVRYLFPCVMDRDGQVGSTWHIGGPNNGVPATYFIDRAGVVRLVVFGSLTQAKMDQGLSLILPEGT